MSALEFGSIGDGESRMIIYLYGRSVEGAPIEDTSNLESVPEDTEFVFEGAGMIIGNTGPDEPEFVFE